MAKSKRCKCCRKSPVAVGRRSGFCIRCLDQRAAFLSGELECKGTEIENLREGEGRSRGMLQAARDEAKALRAHIDEKDAEIRRLAGREQHLELDLATLGSLLAQEVRNRESITAEWDRMHREAKANQAEAVNAKKELPPPF